MDKEYALNNFHKYGFSVYMGDKLRAEVERQLLLDLAFYKKDITNDSNFDWSQSIIEGHTATYLDGTVENFSGIKILNAHDELIAEGWMDFIYEKELDKEIFIAYWNFLHICENAVWIDIKAKPGIPSHIYEKLSDKLKGNMPKLGLNR